MRKNEIVLDIEQHGFIVGGLCIDEISDVYMNLFVVLKVSLRTREMNFGVN